MSLKPRTWFAVSLVLFAGGVGMWRYAERVRLDQHKHNAQEGTPLLAAPMGPGGPMIKAVGTNAAVAGGRKSYRVSNTRQTMAQLLHSDHAIILRNALIDTTRPLRLDIPSPLRHKGPAGSYIVQFDRALDGEFYGAVKRDGGEFVSYIPNNAGLVKADADSAKALEADPVFQAVLPYEPYYKLDGSLLPGAVEGEPQTHLLSVTTFAGERDAALAALNDLGATLVGEDQGPFGPTLVVTAPPESVAAIAQLPLAQEVETYSRRRLLNDLSRVQLGVSVNTLTNTPDYLNLSGSNITVSLNDTGVDSTHKDFAGAGTAVRLKGAAGALVDNDGHGTHVAGTIIGNGSQSGKVTNQIPGSIIPGADFRGKATNATLYVQNLDLIIGPFVSDNQLQINASTNLGPTNLISNNSWGYSGTSYDIHAASYDAATRDAQPMLKGEQPLLFVFASGDSGQGDNSGVDGQGGTINSPGSAKNVITVGATDTPRFLTNLVSFDGQSTNQVFLGETDNSNLVTYFSGCGNVDLGVEGMYGRFKPDVVAPGAFIVSCRSSNYVDPTNETLVTDNPVTNQAVDPGKTNYYPLQFPTDGSELIIQIVTNSGTPAGFTNGFIVRADGQTPPLNIRGTNILGANVVVLTNQIVPGPIYVGVASAAGTLQPVTYDLHMYVLETNSFGDEFTVLSNMNKALAPSYRYETGTSMSAAAVSGVLALMQDFLENRLKITPSPALLKALLINGSRTIGLEYDFDVKTLGANEQGWGMPNLGNSIPSSFTNSASGRSLAFYDQSPANALATGQYQTYTITDPTGNASNAPVRISLVWTDPPGDPAAGIALVNQLSLTVTDSTGTNVFIGNDFFGGDIFSEANTGNAPDAVNNVQNIYIDPAFTPVAYPLTVRVGGARVNVNAVTTRTNIIGQDYALVISGDDPTIPLAVASNAVLTLPPTALVTDASSGQPLLHERVGANQPTLWDYATGGTNGSLTQWHFFVFTNMSLYTNGPKTTNVAFATFLPPNLSAPRNTQADIDMYVSTNPKLLQLDKEAVYQSFKSVGRGGTETFVTNSTATNWYIGIKSEDQQAADFGFYAVAQVAPFSLLNPDGSVTASGTALPVFIPDAASERPALVFAFLIDPINPAMRIQDVTVQLGIQAGNPSDLYGTLAHNGVSTVINHNTGGLNGFTNVYDDLQEQPSTGDILTDGPGSLRNFVNQSGQGLWMLTESDNALGQTGEVESFSITGTPEPAGLGFTITIQPDSWYKGYVPIPNDATNLTIFTTYASQGGGPVGIFLTNFDDVNFGDYTTNLINPPGGSLSLNTNPPKPFPPLSGGNWYYGIYNYNDSTPVTLNVLIQIEESLTPNLVQTFSNNTTTPLLTDGHTQSQICIASGQQLVDLSVGLRINDTNLDDLSIHLTSPEGTSVLLFENRGGLAAQNLGLGSRTTSNLVYTVFTEDTNLTQTPIKFASTFASLSPLPTVIMADGFESAAVKTYTNGQVVEGGWEVATNQVGVVADANIAHAGNNFLALTTGRITNAYATIPGRKYEIVYWARGPGITDWYPGDGNANDIVGGNNGTLVGDAAYAVGEVGEAFSLGGPTTGEYVSIPDNASLHLSSLTTEQWVDFQRYPLGDSGSTALSTLIAKPYAPVTDQWDSYIVWTLNGTLSGAITSSAGVEQPAITYTWDPSLGTWHHVAYTFDNPASLQSLYVDGLPVASGPVSGPIVYDSHPLQIGADFDGGIETFFFEGKIDETSVYNRALSPVEIQTIYNAGSAGKYNSNSLLPNFVVSVDGYSTNTEILTNFSGPWQPFTNSFIATNNQVTVEFAGNTLSTLFDDIQFVELPATNFNNDYLPEEPLTPFIGENPQGCWTLDVWDTRTDSPLPDDGTLLSWDLQTTISSTNVSLTVLSNAIVYTNGSVPGDSITYFAVDVPATANYATNILSRGSHPLNLIFDQSSLPTGGLPGDVTLISGLKAGTSGAATLAAQGPPPPLLPGRRYFLGVQNTGPKGATYSLEVKFDVSTNSSAIKQLTNQVVVATNVAPGSPEYYAITVPGNATLVTFQVLNSTLPLSLYARAGLPVPGPLNYDYTSSAALEPDQFIVITTNSTPLPLPTTATNSAAPIPPTTWYLAVYNAGAARSAYSIMATFATNGPSGSPGSLDVMQLKSGFARTGTAQPGFTTNTIYALDVLNNPAGVQFVLTNKSAVGGLELLAGLGAFPTPAHAFDANYTAGTTPLSVVVGKGAALPSVDGVWYLAIANTSATPIPYTLTGTVIPTGTVTTTPFDVGDPSATAQPSFIGSRIASPSSGISLYWTATPGQNYNIEVSTDLLNWSFVTNITAQSNTAAYTDSTPATLQPARFFRISTQ